MSSKTPKNYISSFYNTTTIPNNNNTNQHLEFDEQELFWQNNSCSSASSSTPEEKRPSLAKRALRKPWSSLSGPSAASSMPVKIPDWSKMMGKEANDDQYSDDNEDDELEERLPPHEYVAKKLARSRIVPFSVHEGVGRTLKGRDLSRVRNAVWKQTGFED